MGTLLERRTFNWRQTPERRLSGPDGATEFIDQVGIATLFPASPEIPNLFHAFLGDPDAKTDSGHDTPSGQVYGWRWTLGRDRAAFYTAIVRKRPTWVSWRLLPAVLRLQGELRGAEELYATGMLSDHAVRIVRALRQSEGELTTGELRKAAGFPTGKSERASYLKAVEELETQLILAKVFALGDLDMRHVLVRDRYLDQVDGAEALSRDDAFAQLLRAYLPLAVYIVPATLSRHLGVPEAELIAALERLLTAGVVSSRAIEGQKGTCYVWNGGSRETS